MYVTSHVDFPKKSWNFEIVNSKPPRNAFWETREGTYLMFSHSNRNIAHFTEVFNFVYHYLHYPSSYLPIERIYFPQYKRDVIYPWILRYMEVAQSIFPADRFFDVLLIDDMGALAKSGLVCFRHAVVSVVSFHSQIGVGRISSYFYGGVFTDMQEVDTLRAATYKHYSIDTLMKRTTLPTVLVMVREMVHGNLPGRAIANVEEVRHFFQTHSQQYHYSEKKLELMTPREQIETLSQTDVFIGALGSGFANVVYMIPGSVAISYSPPHVGGFFFDTLCELARIHYIGVFNSSAPLPPECRNRINANGESTVRACLDILYADNIFMNVEQLESLLVSAVIHLNAFKFSPLCCQSCSAVFQSFLHNDVRSTSDNFIIKLKEKWLEWE